MTRSIRTLALLALLAPFTAAPARADLAILPDSTVHEVWVLANGLKVVAHHISTCHHVAISLAWPTGSDADPAGQSGRAALLAEVLFTAEAGDVPERTRAELGSIRPSGWGVAVGPRVTQLTEVATLPQFPGTLHQVAQRLRGATVSDSVLRRALASVREDLVATRQPTGNPELYSAVRRVALGSYSAGGWDAGLKALSKLKRGEVQAQIASTFPAGGAVLSLAGNLGDINLHALVENEFGSIPAGARPSSLPPPRFRHATVIEPRMGLGLNTGVIGVFAPALDDTLHPSFYFASLLFAGAVSRTWGRAPAPLTSRFQYSLFDDPDLARFYPPGGAERATDSTLDAPFEVAIGMVGSKTILPDAENPILRGVLWLLGAPMPPEVLARAARDPSVVATVANNQAARELWGGEPFWSEYRARFIQGPREYDRWVRWMLDPANRAKLVLTPPR